MAWLVGFKEAMGLVTADLRYLAGWKGAYRLVRSRVAMVAVLFEVFVALYVLLSVARVYI